MQEIKIKSGMWMDLQHTNGSVFVENLTTGEEFEYGINRDDKEELNIELLQMIDEEKIILTENPAVMAEAGLIPLQPEWIIHGGKLYFEEQEKIKTRQKIRERLDELYSGYEQARAERSETFRKNRNRKIDNLLNAENHPDFPFLDLEKLEDE